MWCSRKYCARCRSCNCSATSRCLPVAGFAGSCCRSLLIELSIICDKYTAERRHANTPFSRGRERGSQCIRVNSVMNPNNPLASKPPPTPPCQGECPVCPSPDKGRLGGVGVEFLPNGQSGIKRTVFFISNGYTIEKSFLTEACHANH